MKKLSLLLLIAVLIFGFSARFVFAGEADDRQVAELFAAAEKIRSYGEYCWETRFTGEWTPPKASPLENEFRFYAMETKALNCPEGPNFYYRDFMKQWVLTGRKFNPGERALVFCLPAALSFAQFKEAAFIPWVPLDKMGDSKKWVYAAYDGKVFARRKWEREGIYAFLTGVKAVQDFICCGADDPNVLKIEGDSITFKTRDNVDFSEREYEEFLQKQPAAARAVLSQFLTEWRDESGTNVLNRKLKPGKTYTLVFTGVNATPRGWSGETADEDDTKR